MLVSRICGSRHYFLWRTTVNLRCSQIYFQPCSYSISDCKDGTSANHYRPSFEVKHFSTSSIFCEKEKLKPSSLVEETVDSMREEEKRKQDLVSVSGEQKKEIAKKSLWARFVGELKHYYHGFRLLYIESKIAFGFAWKMLKGESLSRREHKQLVRTTADLFRLVPFSVFIIIPFMEFLLPVFIKLFPSMLPSTFQSANEKEAKIKANLKLKLEMARFLQQTLDDMALKGKGRESERAREFVEFFNRVRTSGEAASNEEIMRFSKLFEDEITLESLTRPQLLALCRLLEIQPMGTNNFLRFQLQLKLRSLAADDKVIQKEGLESLTASELQAACRARGMRSHGFPAERLRQQLTQWLDLSLNEKVPPSLLLLSRTLYLPESVPTTDQLKATISSLPESITIPTEDAIAEKEGRIDNVVRLKLIKEEQEKIKAEREEQKKMEAEKKKKGLPEVLVDVAPILQDRAKALERKKEEEFSSDDLAALEDALENVGVEKRKLLLEKEELSEIKKELQDYEEDLKDLDKFMKSSGQPPQFLRESKAARRLYKRVNNIIGNLDDLVHSLEKNKKILKEEAKTVSAENGIVYDELVSVTELIQAIKKLQRIDDDVKLEKIEKVLGKLDTDRDGSIKVDDVMKVIEMIGKEHFDLSGKQVSDIIDMLHKEGEISREITMYHPSKAKLVTKESPPTGSSDSLTGPQPIRYREKSGIVIDANVTPKMKEQMEMNVQEKLKHGQTVETKNVLVSLEDDEKKVKIEIETLGNHKAEEKLKEMIPPPEQLDDKKGDKENRL